jgi:hypothetical protein
VTRTGQQPGSAPPRLRQIQTVVADLPRFVTAPLYRRRHLTWGATPVEVAAALPGDEIVQQPQFRCTRAITINAPPQAVWPWLVQDGCHRAGWYSNDLLDNLGRPSATNVVTELQQLEVGQWVAMSPVGPPSAETAFKVAGYQTNRWLLWTKPDATWVSQLTSDGPGRTRLITRNRTRHEWRRPGAALLSVFLMEFGDFAMMRRMLLGLRDRAEALAADHERWSAASKGRAARRGRARWSTPTVATLGAVSGGSVGHVRGSSAGRVWPATRCGRRLPVRRW